MTESLNGQAYDCLPAVDGGRRRPRRRVRAVLMACVVLVSSAVVSLTAVGGRVAPAGAAAGPACNFSNSLVGVVIVTKKNQVVNVSCTGLTPNHPYLLVEISLLVAIDPSARPLLTGASVTSEAGLLAALAAAPEINATSEGFPITNSKGALNYNYTVPSTQPTDPNATCPPSSEQNNSGMIGCAIAMLDATSGTPVEAGTFVLHWASSGGIFPADPTLHLSSVTAKKGQVIKVSDAPNAKTFWWLSTLLALDSLLAGGSPPAFIRAKVTEGGKVLSSALVTPASYVNEVFTPPKLSGWFVAQHVGRKTVKVSITANLLGFPLSNVVKVPMKVTNH
ncbi:MAG TPA: hypothetical protein VLZ77_17395 [Acidimicrobiales bacterium]|nr:hypothetical protein [Acidimicrobiales bacterium]